MALRVPHSAAVAAAACRKPSAEPQNQIQIHSRTATTTMKSSSFSPSSWWSQQWRLSVCVWTAMTSAILLALVAMSNMSSQAFTRPFSAGRRIEPNSCGLSAACEGRRVYMYDLPPSFNSALMAECNRTIVPWLEFCAHATNQGLGPAVPDQEGWHATDLYMLEVVFHHRMLQYPCLVNRPERADVFFIPYYSGFDALSYLYGENRHRPGDHGRALILWLNTNSRWFRRRNGADHFMVTGRTSWDFHLQNRTPAEGGWGTGLLDLPELGHVTILAVEGRPWVPREQAVPYLTSFHPVSAQNFDDWMMKVLTAERRFLFSFVGSSRKGLGIRDSIITECMNCSACNLIDCSKIKCSHNPIPVAHGLLESEFCLQPPGDSPTRRSTFDGLIAGCIPVFFRNDSAYEQYTWHLPAETESYSVFIEENAAVERGVLIEQVLRSYSKEKIKVMRSNIVNLIPSLIYRGFEASDLQDGFKDAFDRSVDGMLLSLSRSKTR